MANQIHFVQFQGPQQVRRVINNPTPNSLLGFDANGYVANITAATPASVASTGAVTSSSPSAGLGYATGAGAAVTQATNASTAVVVTGMSGAITTVVQNIAAGAEVQFTVTNTSVAVGDVPMVAIRSGSVGGTTVANVTVVAAGSFQITLTNLHATVAETGTLIINFAVLKAVSA